MLNSQWHALIQPPPLCNLYLLWQSYSLDMRHFGLLRCCSAWSHQPSFQLLSHVVHIQRSWPNWLQMEFLLVFSYVYFDYCKYSNLNTTVKHRKMIILLFKCNNKGGPTFTCLPLPPFNPLTVTHIYLCLGVCISQRDVHVYMRTDSSSCVLGCYFDNMLLRNGTCC